MKKSSRPVIDGGLASLLLVALINVSIVAAAPTHTLSTAPSKPGSTLSVSEDELPLAKGLDSDGVPYVVRSDGTKARYIQLDPTSIKLQLSKNGVQTGRVEFHYSSGGTFSARYAPAKGKTLSAVTEINQPPDKNVKPSATLTLQYGKHVTVLQGDAELPSKGIPATTLKRLEYISTEVRKNNNLLNLFNDVRFFAKKSTLHFAMPFADSGGSCAWDAASCVASLIEYGLGWALIAELCGVTVGAGCILALFWHPVAGAMVAKHCSAALESCGILAN